MKENTQTSIPLFGGSSLLVIFAVLVLTVFLLLTLTSVQADQRLADASVQAVIDYYEADLQAEEIFAQLRSGAYPEQVQYANELYRYTCQISEAQNLDVVLRKTEEGWQVLRWKNVATDTESTAILPIWDGNTVLEVGND